MNSIKIYSLLIFLFSIKTIAQDVNGKNTFPIFPRDTVYYDDGQIKSFNFKHGYYATHGSSLFIYYDSICNKKKQKQSIIKEFTRDYSWTTERTFFRDSLFIVNEYGFGANLKDFTSLDFYLKTKDKYPLAISFMLDKDTLIKRISVFKPKSFKIQVEKMYYSSSFKIPTLYDNDLNVEIGAEGFLTIQFSKSNGFLRRFIYNYNLAGDNSVNFIVNFYKNNIIKEYGEYHPPFGRQGKWFTYYKNGKILSEGEYSGSEFDKNGNEINLKKSGKWIYYTENGCIEKEEKWDKGELVKSIYSKKK